ncbi:Glutaminase [Hahella chejuensis KCTC 2396]|uniref:Glutaminase n=1 Tax=Hahella chejuensis (strain KCTC 2396) TaxID=349521 RepID=GLSA_HAHCH|nr:glutaminase [Hahella chejuensis]Q2S6X2.1 RecName: Full=Glutaminase [Hahella chejuensis KCTC 2396]ABC33602.1 Glutaminase [Hahella chejuensis KCTC 2396]
MKLQKSELPALLERIYSEVTPLYGVGKTADYIPPLSRVNPRQFGMAIRFVDGDEFTVGQASTPFSIQSISKLFALMLALDIVGDDLWKRVGREPSGMRFNSLLQLENENGIPRNPFINAGAIVVTDTIVNHSASPVKRLEQFMASLSGNVFNRYDPEVYVAEARTGYRNAAIANLLKALGNLEGEVDVVLDSYYKQCSMTMSCLDLARATESLANKGKSSFRTQFHGERMDKRVNALMLTCGLYDAAGNFAYQVGLPAKSGVGGGIVAVLPGYFSVAVWSPELDSYGNSVLGQKALELLTHYTSSSIF